MPDISDELAKLGLPPPSQTPEPDPTDHEALSTAEIILELAKHGVHAVTTDAHIVGPSRGSYTMNGVTVRAPCDHPRVEVGLENDRLRCRDCRAGVNPIWWIARYASCLQRGEEWLRALKRDRKRLEQEIDELKKERAKHKAAIRRKK